MPTFTYKGTTADGSAVEETLDAADRFAVYDHARASGHLLVSLAEQHPFSLGRLLRLERARTLFERVTQDEIVMLSRNLGAMLRAGLALTRALSVSERQTGSGALRRILGDIREQVQKGTQFHESLAAYPRVFSPLYVAMVRAGEEGGLAEALAAIALQLEQSSNLKKKIRGAMVYPAIVITAMLGIGVLMMIFVVPTLTQTFAQLNIELPLTTRIILGISGFLSAHTVTALGALVGAIVGFVAAYRTAIGRAAVEWTLLRLPVIGTLVKETNAARTARTLSSLLRAGVDVVGALSITEDVVQHSAYKKVLADAAAHVQKGKPLSEDFINSEDFYPVLVGEMVSVGEETGQIPQMLEEIAVFYESEVERKTKDLSTVIEPVLMVVIGAAVGFFALAVISPIYSISDSIN
jgi:type II secretory pathway component PulF